MMVKIFWQEKCPSCPQAKALGKKLELDEGMDITYYNIKEADGLSEAIMYDLMSTPSVIICEDNGDEIKGFRGNVPSVNDIKSLIK